jgi:hypothetical protein
VAEILTEPLGTARTSLITVIQFNPPASRQFLIRGDQWMIEGDILKWDDWLNFLGLETRYRLTRVRGRYVSTQQETWKSPRSIPWWGMSTTLFGSICTNTVISCLW